VNRLNAMKLIEAPARRSSAAISIADQSSAGDEAIDAHAEQQGGDDEISGQLIVQCQQRH